ncbi:MAG: glycosyltransferase [Ignavibacteriales bacterium]|nr:glycosyltransferase [Ignavibacteriales bacterium]
MINLLHCLTHSDAGGGQAAVFTLAKSIVRFHPDVRITVMLPVNGIYVDRFKDAGFEVIPFPFESISLKNIYLFKRLVANIKPDIIHSHGKGAGFYSRMSTYLGLSCPRIHTHHGFHLPPGSLRKNIYLRLEQNLTSRTDTIIAVSPSEQKELCSIFEKYSKRIINISNVIDSDELIRSSVSDLPSNVDAFLNASNDKIVLMIARDDEVKNYPLALNAAEIVLKQNKKARFIFVGLRSDNQLYSSIKLSFGGKILTVEKMENVIPLFKRCDILLLTSRKEGGLPLVIQEGFYFGKPAVGTKVPGITDLIDDRINGLLSDETPESVANAIIRLVEDDNLYRMLSVNAKKKMDSFNLPDWAEKYYNLYRSYVGK